MKQVVFKYTLSPGGDTALMLPQGAEVLAVRFQQGAPRLWAAVNPDETKLAPRVFYTVTTGMEFRRDDTDVFIGTYFAYGGNSVFHVFESTE